MCGDEREEPGDIPNHGFSVVSTAVARAWYVIRSLSGLSIVLGWRDGGLICFPPAAFVGAFGSGFGFVFGCAFVKASLVVW